MRSGSYWQGGEEERESGPHGDDHQCTRQVALLGSRSACPYGPAFWVGGQRGMLRFAASAGQFAPKTPGTGRRRATLIALGPSFCRLQE